MNIGAFMTPEELIEAQHLAIQKEIQAYFIGFPDAQLAFLDNLIKHCQYNLAAKKLIGKPLSEDFLRGATEIMATLQNLKETMEKKRNGT